MTVKTSQLIETLKQLISETDVKAIVVGLPRTLSSADTNQTVWVRQWIEAVKKQIDKPFYFQDEAMTTREAEKMPKVHKKDNGEDAIAAAIILQDFLDMAGNKR